MLETIRDGKRPSAIIFLHGFTGDADGTWERFPFVVGTAREVSERDIYSVGYSTSASLGLPGWSRNPGLATLSTLLANELSILPLSQLSEITFVAHSMGGLIAQQLLVSHPEIAAKVKHLFLLGTPSNGMENAGFIDRFLHGHSGPQIHDMAAGSAFIRQLRAAWKQKFAGGPPFSFYAVAGDRDNFVKPESSLGPFEERHQRVVSGDHVTMVKPKNGSADVVRLVISALTQTPEPAILSAPLRLASELGNAAPGGMLVARAAAAGRYVLKSESEIVDAALALDRAGLQHDAIKLLQNNEQFGTDVKGTLAGRIKRRWIQEHHADDAIWALNLYSEALQTARAVQPPTPYSIGQVFYHAINVAYFKLLFANDLLEARAMAALALDYARKLDTPDLWSVATEAEALMHMGQDQLAMAKYRQVIEMSPEKWKLLSTSQQALQVAEKLGRPELLQQLKNLFEPEPPSRQRASSTTT